MPAAVLPMKLGRSSKTCMRTAAVRAYATEKIEGGSFSEPLASLLAGDAFEDMTDVRYDQGLHVVARHHALDLQIEAHAKEGKAAQLVEFGCGYMPALIRGPPPVSSPCFIWAVKVLAVAMAVACY